MHARQAAAYRGRLSGPLLDRIDLHVEVPRLSYAEMTGPPGESLGRVVAAGAAARGPSGGRRSRLSNARLSGAESAAGGRPRAGEAERSWRRAMDQLGLSARGHDRILRVARTIADLEAIESVAADHVAEALQFRRCGVDTNG